MKKKYAYCLILIAVMMLISSCSAEPAPPVSQFVEPIATDASGDFEYEDHGTNVVIFKYNGSEEDVVIPSAIDGKSVRGISERLFTGRVNITSVTIPDSVVFIEDEAFFIGASPLRAINVDPSNAYFKSMDGILYNRDMTELVFYPIKTDSSYTMPDSVASIDKSAFDCHNPYLTSITLSDNMAADGITGTIFYNCVSLTALNARASSLNYESCNGILYNKGKTALVRCPAGITGAFTVPGGVTAIGEGAFNCSTKLTSITLPGSLRYIGTGAFNYCSEFKSVNIPDGVTEINRLLFSYCRKLTDVVIPDSVTSIDGLAFAYSGLKSVTIPDSVTAVGSEAFSGCADLAEAVFTGDMPALGSGVFDDTADGFKAYYHISRAASWAEDTDFQKQPYCIAKVDPQNGEAVYEAVAGITDGHIAPPEAPVRTGYTFAGWYKEAEGRNPWDFDAEDNVTGDITLFAKWSRK